MKLTLLLSVVTMLLSYATCRNFQKTPEAATAPAVTEAKPERMAPGGRPVSHVIEGSHPDNENTLQVVEPPKMVEVPLDGMPPASASRKAYLSTGWWNFNMAFQPSDTTVHHNYQHKWLKFREDQTFDLLINNKVVDKGRWNWDDQTDIIYISCHDPYINNTWQVTEKGFLMIWKGNTALNVTGIQIRVIDSKSPPPSN
ncbi:MAG: hypothetical protein ABIO24_07605 [Saprospiraceae bacterium]